jgi:hypothetical protein
MQILREFDLDQQSDQETSGKLFFHEQFVGSATPKKVHRLRCGHGRQQIPGKLAPR